MTPLKTTLFLMYCLTAVAALGAGFSQLWQINKQLAAEIQQVAAVRSSPRPGL